MSDEVRKKHSSPFFSRSKAPMIGFVRTCPHHRTDVSAPSYRRVRTKTTTGPHFLEPEGARFPMCEIASVRVKRPTEGNTDKGKGHRRKENQRKYRQPEKHKSPEKALRGHQLVFWCKEAPSRAIHLTFCHSFDILSEAQSASSIVNGQLTIDNYLLVASPVAPNDNCPLSIVNCQLTRVYFSPKQRSPASPRPGTI